MNDRPQSWRIFVKITTAISGSKTVTVNEHTPLVPKNLGKGSMTSTRHVRRIVQECFDNAYERVKRDGLVEDAIDLKAATVHWLRHTGISTEPNTI